MNRYTSVEICAGGGGQALGLERAGFEHVALLEIDKYPCETLKLNRPNWNVIEGDIRNFSGVRFAEVDLLSGGIPCPPFSVAGKQLGANDERDLFPEALRLVSEIRPRIVMIENVQGLASKRFTNYRICILRKLCELGYHADWRLINASDYGVPQHRTRFILVALRREYTDRFFWPERISGKTNVGETVKDIMASRGWSGAERWVSSANRIAPTIVGGSKKHGGPDLGPTRARREWLELRVDGLGIADNPPDPSFPADGNPRLTVRMVARLQGFPDEWQFSGGKTAAYRQVGNAFPPPVAAALGSAIYMSLSGQTKLDPISLGLTGFPLLDLMEQSGGVAQEADVAEAD